MSMNQRQKAVLGAGALGAAALWLANDAEATTGSQQVDEAAETLADSIEEWVPVSEDGEVGIDALTGVVYDDPESGAANDERADDPNTSFETVNTNETAADDTDPTTYAPDTEGAAAPDSGVLADPGTSQEFGTATEQSNDDLNTAGELDDATAAAFDRLANFDSVEEL